MHRRFHGIEQIAILVVLVAILAITFWPTRVDAPLDSGLRSGFDLWHSRGLPQFVDYAFVEAAGNVLLFLPLGALVASLLLPSLWWASAVLGLALSLVIEGGQAVFLPQRVASAGDLAANTAGALVGGVVVVLLRRRRARRPVRYTKVSCP